jgi:uncharacterized LabA/DUF88 family protein
MSTPSIYLYVDGESHFSTAERCWKRIQGEAADLNSLRYRENAPALSYRIALYQPAKFFWDPLVLSRLFISDYNVHYSNLITRRVYFTSFTGGTEGLQEARVKIREAGFEPEIVSELKDRSKQRENQLKQDGLLIKPKGVDIGVAVRMLEDAYHGNYDWCILATSDVDYLPVLKAIRRMGKQVFVIGYGEAIAKDSPFLSLRSSSTSGRSLCGTTIMRRVPEPLSCGPR